MMRSHGILGAVPQPPPANSQTTHQPLRLAFYALAVSMALINCFITFRGLSSPTGMEQAQIAREMARGRFFQTKVIRPFAWAQMIAADRDPAPTAMPDISQPPLQSLLWAPVFKVLRRHQVYEPEKNGSVYLLDRAIACIGVTGYLLTILFTHGAARRLFDDSVAGITALALVLCQPLWNLSISGNPAGLLLPLFALAFRVYVSAAIGLPQGESITRRLLFVGLLAAMMVMTHWMAVWLVLGIVLAAALTLPGKRTLALFVALPPLACLALWGWWTLSLCGDPMGGAKTLFQAHLLSSDPHTLQREFSLAMPQIRVDDLLRKLGQNWQAQLGDLVAHVAWLVPALFFFTALLHRFRRPETMAVRAGLGLMLLCLALGTGLLGLADRATDDNSLYMVIAPAMTTFGIAMIAVLWARLQPPGAPFWSRWGYAVIAIAVSAVPMAVTLPVHLKMGLTMGKQVFPHWPPYLPERVAIMNKLVEPGEIIFSDAPWFVAWYADVPTVWLPNKRADFTAMAAKAEAHNKTVAGVVVTPVSGRVNYLADIFTGAYREWPDLVFRGPMIAFDKDFAPRPDFSYRVVLPLAAQPVGDKENLSLLMTFYTDKPRKPRE